MKGRPSCVGVLTTSPLELQTDSHDGQGGPDEAVSLDVDRVAY